MRRTLIAALALGSLLGSASGLRAQTIPSPIRYVEQKHSVGVSAGYLFTDPAVEINEAQIELGPQSGPLVSARYNIRFGGPLSGEVRVGFSPTERKVYAPTGETNPQLFVPTEVGTESAQLVMADAGLVFHLTGPRTWHRLAPYLVGTGGLASDLNRGSDLEANITEGAQYDFGPSFALGLGLGTDWFPTRRLSVRLEGRDRLWKIEAPPGFANPAGKRSISEWTHNFSVTLGAALHF
ncbi:MAG TPA: hypothetical protein VGR37_15970 [Longimicrobiaceae bacterium]|nr:hypothetical protein [Longimicrobiaceae bacterium]